MRIYSWCEDYFKIIEFLFKLLILKKFVRIFILVFYIWSWQIWYSCLAAIYLRSELWNLWCVPNIVTLRERDSKVQLRIPLDDIGDYSWFYMEAKKNFLSEIVFPIFWRNFERMHICHMLGSRHFCFFCLLQKCGAWYVKKFHQKTVARILKIFQCIKYWESWRK